MQTAMTPMPSVDRLGTDCYNAITTLIGRFLPKDHVMPANLYQSDKILKVLKMPYEQIHACENGCALFRKEYADEDYCPKCKSSRYVVVDNGQGEMTQTKIRCALFRKEYADEDYCPKCKSSRYVVVDNGQ